MDAVHLLPPKFNPDLDRSVSGPAQADPRFGQNNQHLTNFRVARDPRRMLSSAGGRHRRSEHPVYDRHILGIVAATDPLENCSGFDWDDANSAKNWERHQVTPEEAEDVFFHAPFVVRGDVRHSKREKRYYALGQTTGGRRLFVAFTLRRKLIRVISARDMNRNETETYKRYEKETA